MVERGDVVRDLDDVVERDAGRLLDLEEQQVGERGLRALDLRREHGFLADVGVEEERLVGQEGRDAVESAEREDGGLEQQWESPSIASGGRRAGANME